MFSSDVFFPCVCPKRSFGPGTSLRVLESGCLRPLLSNTTQFRVPYYGGGHVKSTLGSSSVMTNIARAMMTQQPYLGLACILFWYSSIFVSKIFSTILTTNIHLLMRGEVLPFFCPISHTFTVELHLPHAAVIVSQDCRVFYTLEG
jgi:hypothetical protein